MRSLLQKMILMSFIFQAQIFSGDTYKARYAKQLEDAKKASPDELTVMILKARKKASNLNLEAQCAKPFCAEGSPLDQECELAFNYVSALEEIQTSSQ